MSQSFKIIQIAVGPMSEKYGLGNDGLVYEWIWDTGEWELYKR